MTTPTDPATPDSDATPVVSTKVVAATAAAGVSTPLVSIAAYEIGTLHLDAAVATPLTALVGTVIVGAVTFAAGYLRRELARFR